MTRKCMARLWETFFFFFECNKRGSHLNENENKFKLHIKYNLIWRYRRNRVLSSFIFN